MAAKIADTFDNPPSRPKRPAPIMNRDFVKLHMIIAVWGLTAILGKAIDLPALEIVLYRTAIAAACLMLILRRAAAIPLGIDHPAAGPYGDLVTRLRALHREHG